MRRNVTLSALAATAILLGACGSDDAASDISTSSVAAATTQPSADAGSTVPAATDDSPAGQVCAGDKVAFVSTQKAGDQSVVDDMITNGLEASKSQLGADTQYVESLDPATFESTLRNVANAGADVIATTFLEMGDPLKAVAAEFPEIHFVQIYAEPVEPAIPNLRTVSYRYDEATYLSGLVAGSVTTTKVLGYEAGLLVPSINTDFNAFKSAAESVDPSIRVIPGEVGSFSDDAKAKEVVSALYTQGADIVQGDGPVLGHIEAAKDKGKYAIIGAPGLVAKAPALVMGVTFIHFGQSLFDQIEGACGTDFVAGHTASGVTDDITGFYVPDEFLAAGDPAVVSKVKAALPLVDKAIADIKSGALEVPVDPTAP